jgi:thioesterase domain-containing protein
MHQHETVGPRNDVERDLLSIWEDVLQVRPIGITDNFFDLGGHSFRAALLMNQVKEKLGHTLPLGLIFEAGTVEKMAAVLQQQLEAGSDHCLVPFHESGNRPPLFLIAGVGGHVFTFHKFARMLGKDQSAYGVKAIGVDGLCRPPDRLEEIAAQYLEEILSVRPRGPYLLGGYSVGAQIAYELAVQMQARGLEVGPLIVFDCPAPGYPIPLPLLQRLWVHLRNFWKGGGRSAYAAERYRNVRDRLLLKLGLGMLVAPEIEGVHALPQDHLKKVWVALQTAMKRYRPRERLRSGVVLFQAEDAPEWNSLVKQDPVMGWREWACGPIHQHVIPGAHLDMFHDRNINNLASTLNDEIDRWTQERGER